MRRIGIVGWRGMVGSVLLSRMREEGDFDLIDPVFFSTSQVGQPAPDVGTAKSLPPLADAFDVEAFRGLDAVITCQGGDYTKRMHPELRKAGWDGYWIDAASALRMDDRAIIILDPVNRSVIDAALEAGQRDFIGGNCTVSLMLLGMHGLIEQGWVEWISSMTYQAASGAGAKNMRELLLQMRALGQVCGEALDDPSAGILALDKTVTEALRGNGSLPTQNFGAPLAGSLLPWIDSAVEGGGTREEWKGHVEANKLMQLDPVVPIDGICVRIGAMRCHSQALTIKLAKDVPVDEIEDVIARSNDWASVVPNDKAATIQGLTPAAVTGTLDIPVGRIHKLRMGPDFLGAMTVGDQLLWGAAEPLRRMLRILLER